MGSAILGLLGEDDAIKPVQLIDRVGSFEPGAMMDAGRWDAVQLRDDLTRDSFDVLIDFSAPEASLQFLRRALPHKNRWSLVPRASLMSSKRSLRPKR